MYEWNTIAKIIDLMEYFPFEALKLFMLLTKLVIKSKIFLGWGFGGLLGVSCLLSYRNFILKNKILGHSKDGS